MTAENGFTTAPSGEAVRGQVGYREVVTSLEVVLVMAGVPLAVMIVLGLLTLGPHLARTRRSRPGQKSNRPPVLWTVNPRAAAQPTTRSAARYGKTIAVIGDQPYRFDPINHCRSLRCER